MNPYDLTIDQFQRIVALQAIPQKELKLKLAVAAVVLDKPLDEVKKLPISKVNDIYRPIKSFQLGEVNFKTRLKIDGQWYAMTLYTDQLKAGQLLELYSYNMTDEMQVVQDLHKILATLARKCRYGKWFPEKYDGGTHAQRAEVFRTKATLRDAWAVVGFFLLLSRPLLQAITTSLTQDTEKTTGKE